MTYIHRNIHSYSWKLLWIQPSSCQRRKQSIYNASIIDQGWFKFYTFNSASIAEVLLPDAHIRKTNPNFCLYQAFQSDSSCKLESVAVAIAVACSPWLHLSKVKERAFLRSHDFGNSLTSAVSARLSVLSFTILQIDQASPGPCKYPGKRVKNIIT